ncbi:MAG TPA: DUF302 domain-containing protein [Chryseolinea sp.]|nr:DUF302 domain-containing protein [Chryseolinea sp.]
MNGNYTKKIKKPFHEVVFKIEENLHEEGFDIVTNIDITDSLKKRQGINFRNYRIIGACNQALGYKLITQESHNGLMLPCNILIQEHENGEVEVSAINPMESMCNATEVDITSVTNEISKKLSLAINHVN